MTSTYVRLLWQLRLRFSTQIFTYYETKEVLDAVAAGSPVLVCFRFYDRRYGRAASLVTRDR